MESNKIVVVGAGSNARVVISILRHSKKWEILGVIDIDYAGQTESIMGITVIGGEEKLLEAKREQHSAFISIGNNRKRRTWYDKLKSMSFNLPNIISDSAYVDSSTQLGEANLICPFCHIGPECSIGDNNILNTRANLEHESSLGDHSHLAPSVTTGGRCQIGDEVFIGAGSVILPKIGVSNEVIVGANSLVTRSISSRGTYVGSPVQQIH